MVPRPTAILRKVFLTFTAKFKTTLLVAVALLLLLSMVYPTRFSLKLVPARRGDAGAYRAAKEPVRDFVGPGLRSLPVATPPPSPGGHATVVQVAVVPKSDSDHRSAPLLPAATAEVTGHFFVSHENGSKLPTPANLAPRSHEDAHDLHKNHPNPQHRESVNGEPEKEPDSNLHDRNDGVSTNRMRSLLEKWRSAGYKNPEFEEVFQDMMNRRKPKIPVEQGETEQKWGDPHRVNFHDPVQRMKYYKTLRNKYSSSLAHKKQNKEAMFRKMVDSMWNGWFEGEQDVQPPDLLQYVAPDASPATLEAEMFRCALAMEVPQSVLELQRQDLQQMSRKLSTFLSAVHSLIPPAFITDYASPCWRSKEMGLRPGLSAMIAHTVGTEGELRLLPNQAKYLVRQAFSEKTPKMSLFCLPHFFIAGFPKSATTTLTKVLFRHPAVSSDAIKENHWWTRAPIISPNAELLKLNVIRYMIHFRVTARNVEQQPYLLSLDGSQSTLWDSNFIINGHDFCSTPAAISHVLPRARFVVLMREPSTRLYSYYLWSCSYKYGNHTQLWPKDIRENPAGTFHREVVDGVEEFIRCREERSLYECTNRYTFTNTTTHKTSCGQIGFRLVVSLYYVHICKFLQFFPREQFLFLKMEDMSTDPPGFMERVTSFLGIDPLPSSSTTEQLSKRRNSQDIVSAPMRQDTLRLLKTFFAPYNQRLVKLIGDKRFLWQD